MQLIFGFIGLFVAFKVGFAYGLVPGLIAGFAVPAILGFVIGSMMRAGSEAISNVGKPVMTMDQLKDLIQKCVYLTGHGAMDRHILDRIEKDLGEARYKNPYVLRPEEFTPPIQKLDFEYADQALRTVLASGYLYAGEGEEIEKRMEAKLDALQEANSKPAPARESGSDPEVERIYEALS